MVQRKVGSSMCSWRQRAAHRALLALLVAACTPRGAPRPKTAPSLQNVAAAATSAPTPPAIQAPVPAPAPPPPLLVGSFDGLFRVSAADGSRVLVSQGPALYPRYIDSESVLVVHPADENGLGRGARLERVSLADGTRKRVAKLPPFRCAGAYGDAMDINVQDPHDFRVSEDGRRACLDLLDRNVNMANISLDVEVDLQSGKVKRALSVGEPECVPPADAKVKRAAPKWLGCGSREPASPRPTARFPFMFEHAPVYEEEEESEDAQERAQGARPIKLQGYGILNRSPSGRWVVLTGDEADGDYLYRRLVLGDRSNGALYAVPDDQGDHGVKPWPSPLATPVEATQTIKRPIESAGLVEGEADLRWLGDADSELLVVGRLVVRPGVSIVTIDGQIAR